MKKVKVGDIVVFNNLPDAAKYDVLAIHDNGFCIDVREHGTDYRPQCSDTSLVAKIIKK
jgi:hypothetical protein